MPVMEMSVQPAARPSAARASFYSHRPCVTEPARTAPSSTPDPAAALQLFCLALDEVNRLERRPVVSAIEYLLCQTDRSLDLPAHGFADIEALAAAAEQRGLVKLVRSGAEILVARNRMAAPLPGVEAMSAAMYRSFLENKLKSPIPPAAMRQRVFTQMAALMADRPPEGLPMPLLDLSYDIARRMAGAFGQRTVFKLLFALVLAGAFAVVRYQQPHQTRVVALSSSPEQCDLHFVRTCLAALRQDRPAWPLDAAALAQVLDIPAADIRLALGTPAPDA